MIETMEAITKPARLESPAFRLNRAARAARWAVTGLFFMNGLIFATWVSRIPVVQMVHGLGNGTLGLALLAIAMGALLAMPATGWLLGRFGSRNVTGAAGLLYAVALPFLALVPGIIPFVVTLFCFGICHGACDVAMNAQAIEIEREYDRPIMSSFHAFFSLGGLAGAALGGLLATNLVSMPAHFVIISIVTALAMAAWTFPRLLRAATPMPDSVNDAAPTKARFAWPSGVLIALGTVAICIMMGEGAMADWSAIYLRRVLNSTEGVAAMGYAAFSVAMAVGRLSGDRFAAFFGPVKVVRYGCALAAAGLLLSLLGRDWGLALVGFACVGLGFAAVVPLVFSAAGRLPGTDVNVALSTVTTLGYLGFLIGPPLIGLVAEKFGLRGGFTLVVGSSLLATALAGSVGRGR